MHMIVIRRFLDFDCFYHMLYYFTEDTVFAILPLAEEYQVLQVKAMCEDCVIQTLQID